jgi:hypothetical protein
VEARAGVTSGSGELGTTLGPPLGYFEFASLDGAPAFGVGVLAPSVIGVRPRISVSYAPPADVSGTWVPCDPGLACPAILLLVDGRASRLEGIVGGEVALAGHGPVRPYVSAGVGFRRYGFSWTPVGEEGTDLLLAAGSHGEIDFLGRAAVGFAFDVGGLEATLEGGADLSAFGAGRVPVPLQTFANDLALYPQPTLDLGRGSLQEYEVSVGLRYAIR